MRRGYYNVTSLKFKNEPDKKFYQTKNLKLNPKALLKNFDNQLGDSVGQIYIFFYPFPPPPPLRHGTWTIKLANLGRCPVVTGTVIFLDNIMS
jgi:hypothetical protein